MTDNGWNPIIQENTVWKEIFMIQFIDCKDMDCREAIELGIKEYQSECTVSTQLVTMDITNALESIMNELRENPNALVAVDDGILVGYLGFLGPWDGVFGNCKGVFSPLGFHAFGGKNRGKVASLLFSEAARRLEEQGVDSFALSCYAHDEEVSRSFVLNGFGIRCSDAMLKLSEYQPSETNSEIQFFELKGKEKEQIHTLFNNLTLHLAASPCFFPSYLPNDEKWFANDAKRVFVAKEGSTILGYMALDEEAENFLTEYEMVTNICGAYVAPEYRSTGVAKLLLDHLVTVAKSEGKEYLGVDCETINPTALRFWGKYFQNYTYSYHRRIDERVHHFKDYFNSFYPENK